MFQLIDTLHTGLWLMNDLSGLHVGGYHIGIATEHCRRIWFGEMGVYGIYYNAHTYGIKIWIQYNILVYLPCPTPKILQFHGCSHRIFQMFHQFGAQVGLKSSASPATFPGSLATAPGEAIAQIIQIHEQLGIESAVDSKSVWFHPVFGHIMSHPVGSWCCATCDRPRDQMKADPFLANLHTQDWPSYKCRKWKKSTFWNLVIEVKRKGSSWK